MTISQGTIFTHTPVSWSSLCVPPVVSKLDSLMVTCGQ